jgi:hypothetical protein
MTQEVRLIWVYRVIEPREMAGPTGIEPATYGLRVRRSSLTELRAHKASFERGFTEKYRAYGLDVLSLLVLLFASIVQSQKTNIKAFLLI